MIHIPALVVGAVVWYYDKEIREFVQKHAAQVAFAGTLAISQEIRRWI